MAQRKKLLELKQKEREKRLDSFDKAAPPNHRPSSSRAARTALSTGGQRSLGGQGQGKPLSEEDQKKIEMRRAIANRLKAEVVGK